MNRIKTFCCLTFLVIFALSSSTIASTRLLGRDCATANLRTWLDRAESYAKLLSDVDDATLAWSLIATTHLDVGSLDDAIIAAKRTGNRRASCLSHIAVSIAMTKGQAQAIEFARSIKEVATRDQVLCGLVRYAARHHEFDRAERIAAMVEQEEWRNAVWHRIAYRRAEAGRYQEARESLKRITLLSDDDKELHEFTLEHIERCEREKSRIKPDRPAKKGLVEGFRSSARAFADTDIDLDNLEQAEAQAKKIEEPTKRVAVWRQLAWAYKKQGDVEDCRRCIELALSSVADIRLPFYRSLNYALLADLELELGNSEKAKHLVQDARNAEPDIFLKGIKSFTTGPVLLGVLIRAGEAELAFRSAKEVGDGSQWFALGAFVALEDKVDELDSRLTEIKSDLAKLNVCLGIVAGLHERQQRPRKAKPKNANPKIP